MDINPRNMDSVQENATPQIVWGAVQPALLINSPVSRAAGYSYGGATPKLSAMPFTHPLQTTWYKQQMHTELADWSQSTTPAAIPKCCSRFIQNQSLQKQHSIQEEVLADLDICSTPKTLLVVRPESTATEATQHSEKGTCRAHICSSPKCPPHPSPVLTRFSSSTCARTLASASSCARLASAAAASAAARAASSLAL
eukprot:1157938-Pelagomonas_calceolata.AAC.2